MQTQSQEPVKTGTDDGTVHVSMKQLIKGVDIVFGGVVEILRSLEPQMAKQLVNTLLDKEETADAKEPNGPVAAADPVSADAPAADADGTDVPADVTPDDPPAAPSVTVDDITKVIVAKIKQKRSNSGVIEKLLKTYKVEKVSELKPSQYEAFLTDLSQI